MIYKTNTVEFLKVEVSKFQLDKHLSRHLRALAVIATIIGEGAVVRYLDTVDIEGLGPDEIKDLNLEDLWISYL